MSGFELSANLLPSHILLALPSPPCAGRALDFNHLALLVHGTSRWKPRTRRWHSLPLRWFMNVPLYVLASPPSKRWELLISAPTSGPTLSSPPPPPFFPPNLASPRRPQAASSRNSPDPVTPATDQAREENGSGLARPRRIPGSLQRRRRARWRCHRSPEE